MNECAVTRQHIEQLARQLGEKCLTHRIMLATAESCTGGGIASAITDIAGSSQWFDRGFVTYSNAAKMDVLGVRQTTLAQFGAVSFETALEMATGCLDQSQADIAVSVTGIAGPSGGSEEKPVGTVFFGLATKNKTCAKHQYFNGDRYQVRLQTVFYALQLLNDGLV